MKNTSKLILVILVLSIVMSGMIMVYADRSEVTNSFGEADADDAAGEIQKSIYQKLAGPALTIGGLAAFLGVLACGFEMIFSKFNPDKRGSAMGSLLWIGGGLLIIGLAGIIAGFLLNMATPDDAKIKTSMIMDIIRLV